MSVFIALNLIRLVAGLLLVMIINGGLRVALKNHLHSVISVSHHFLCNFYPIITERSENIRFFIDTTCIND